MQVNLTIPQQWNDLSETQLENICSALHYNQLCIANNQDPNEINTATFFIVAKELLRGNSYKAIRVAIKELRVNVYNQLVEFIFKKEVALHKFPQLLDGLIAPDVRLRNISIGEFSYVDALYFRWTQTKTVAYLDRVCAALYRPEGKAFDRFEVDKNLEAISKVPFEKKLVVAYAYEGSRNHIVSQYPNVFPKRPEPKNKEKAPKPKYTPFGELISAKIQYDPSKLETVEAMNAYKFLNLYEAELREERKKPKKK